MKKVYEFGIASEASDDRKFLIDRVLDLQLQLDVPMFAVLSIDDGFGVMFLMRMEECVKRMPAIKVDKSTELWCVTKDTYVRIKDREGHKLEPRLFINRQSKEFYDEMAQKFREIRLRFYYEVESLDD